MFRLLWSVPRELHLQYLRHPWYLHVFRNLVLKYWFYLPLFPCSHLLSPLSLSSLVSSSLLYFPLVSSPFVFPSPISSLARLVSVTMTCRIVCPSVRFHPCCYCCPLPIHSDDLVLSGTHCHIQSLLLETDGSKRDTGRAQTGQGQEKGRQASYVLFVFPK